MLDKLFHGEDRKPAPPLPQPAPANERTVFEVATGGEPLTVEPVEEFSDDAAEVFPEDIEPPTAPVITVSERQQQIAAGIEALIREAEVAAANTATGPLQDTIANQEKELQMLRELNQALTDKLTRLREALA